MKEKITEFIELLIWNQKREQPFYNLIPDIELYDLLWETEDALAKALGIPEDTMDYTVREFVSCYNSNFEICKVYDENDKLITSIGELVDFIIRDMERS